MSKKKLESNLSAQELKLWPCESTGLSKCVTKYLNHQLLLYLLHSHLMFMRKMLEHIHLVSTLIAGWISLWTQIGMRLPSFFSWLSCVRGCQYLVVYKKILFPVSLFDVVGSACVGTDLDNGLLYINDTQKLSGVHVFIYLFTFLYHRLK